MFKWRKIAAFFAAAAVAVSCCASLSQEQETMRQVYEIGGRPGRGTFAQIAAYAVNEDDGTLAILEGPPWTISVFNLADGGYLRNFPLSREIEQPVAMWSCGGPLVVFSGGEATAYRADGKLDDEYSLPAGFPKEAGKVLCAPDNGIFVSDAKQNGILLFSVDGKVVFTIPESGQSDNSGKKPRGRIGRLLDFGSDPLGAVYALDGKSGVVLQYDYRGSFRKEAVGGFGMRAGEELYGPVLLAVDSRGEMWIYDRGDRTVREYDDFGYMKKKYYDAGPDGFSFKDPAELRIDRAGSLLMFDRSDMAIKAFDVSE